MGSIASIVATIKAAVENGSGVDLAVLNNAVSKLKVKASSGSEDEATGSCKL